MSEKSFLKVLKFGIYASLAVFLFVFPGLFFPYISSKQLSFNLIIEVLAVIWVFFIIQYPSYRPKKSWITKGILAYLAVLLISAIFGLDFNLSFWGNTERMLGIFHILHFFLFYLMIVSVFRKENDWTNLFIVAVAVGVLIVAAIPMYNNPSSTIGNAAYVAGLMIFDMAFAIYLMIKSSEKWQKVLWGVAAFVCLIGFYKADISGSQVGLLAGILAFGLLYGLISKNKKYGRISLVSTLIVIVLGLGLFSFRNNTFLDDTKLGSMLRAFSGENITWQTRLISWQGAAADFKNHPVLGVGFGNYAHIFDKEFNPRFFDLTPTETYFDRAHNNIVDIASTSGVLGLLAYLAIFVATLIYLFRAYKEDKISPLEASLWFGLLAAYFVQNLAVFDSLVTYVSLFIVLARIHYLYLQDKDEIFNLKPTKEYFGLKVILLLVFILTAYNVNVKGFSMLKNVIRGYRTMAASDLNSSFYFYHKALDNSAPFNRDSRSNFLTSAYQHPELFSKLKPEDRDAKIEYLMSIAEANVNYAREYDSTLELQLSHTARMASRLYYDDLEKFNYYSAMAMVAINNAISASPRRIPLYFLKADLHFSRGEQEETLAAIDKAKELKPDYYQTDCLKATYLYYFERKPEAIDLAIECAHHNLASSLASGQLVADAGNEAIARGDNEAVEVLMVRMEEINKQ